MKKSTNSFAELPTRAVKPVDQVSKKRRAPVKSNEISGNQFSTPALASASQLDTFDTPGVKPVTLFEAQSEYENIPGLIKNESTMMGMKPGLREAAQTKLITPTKKPIAPKPQLRVNHRIKMVASPTNKDDAMKKMKATSRSFYQQHYIKKAPETTHDWEAHNTSPQAIDITNWDSNTGCIQLLMDPTELHMHQQGARLIQSRCKHTVSERRNMIKTIKKTNPSFIDSVNRYYAKEWLGTAVTVDRGNVYLEEDKFDYGDDPYHKAERFKIAQWELQNDPEKFKYDEETGEFYTTSHVSQFESAIEPEEMLDTHVDLHKRTKYDPLMECDDLLTSLGNKLQNCTKDQEKTNGYLASSILNLAGLLRRYVYETECRFIELEKRPIGVAAGSSTGTATSAAAVPERPRHPLFGGGGGGLPAPPGRNMLLSGIAGGIALKKAGADAKGPDANKVTAAKPAGGLDLSQMSRIKLRSAQDPLPIKQNQPQSNQPVFPTLRPSQPRNETGGSGMAPGDKPGFTLPQLREGQHAPQQQQQQQPHSQQQHQPSWMSLDRLKATNNGTQQPVINQNQVTATLAGLKKTGGVPQKVAPQPSQEVAEFQALFLRKTSTSAYIQHQRQQQFTTTSVPGVITFTSPRTRTMNKFNDQFKADLGAAAPTPLLPHLATPQPQAPPEPTPEELQCAADLERIKLEEEALRVVQEKLAKEKKLLEMKAKYTYANIAQHEDVYAHPETRVLLTPILDSKIPDALYEQKQQIAWQQQAAFPLVIGKKKKKKNSGKKGMKVHTTSSKSTQQSSLSLDQFHQATDAPPTKSTTKYAHQNTKINPSIGGKVDDVCPFEEMDKCEREGSSPSFTTAPAAHLSPSTSIVPSNQQSNVGVLPVTPTLSAANAGELDGDQEMAALSLSSQPPTPALSHTQTITSPMFNQVEMEDNLPLPTVDDQQVGEDDEEEEEEEEAQQHRLQVMPTTPILATHNQSSPYNFMSPHQSADFRPASTPTRRQGAATPKMAPRLTMMTPKMMNFNNLISQPLSSDPNRFKNVLGTPQMVQQRRMRDENAQENTTTTHFATPSKQRALMLNSVQKPQQDEKLPAEPKHAFRAVSQ